MSAGELPFSDLSDEDKEYFEAANTVRSRVKAQLQDLFFSTDGFGMALHRLDPGKLPAGMFDATSETEVAVAHTPDYSLSTYNGTNVHMLSFEKLKPDDDGNQIVLIQHFGLDGDSIAIQRTYGERLRPSWEDFDEMEFADRIKGAPYYSKSEGNGSIIHVNGSGELTTIFDTSTEDRLLEDCVFNAELTDAAGAIQKANRLLDLLDWTTLIAIKESTGSH